MCGEWSWAARAWPGAGRREGWPLSRVGVPGRAGSAPLLTALSAVCSAAAGGLRREELHNEVLHKGGGGGAPVPATAPLLGGSPEKEGGGAASGDDFSELPRGMDGIRGSRPGRGCGMGWVGGGWNRRGREGSGLSSAQSRGCPGSSCGSASEGLAVVGGSSWQVASPGGSSPEGDQPVATSTEQWRSCQGLSVFLTLPAGRVPEGPGSRLPGREEPEPLVAGLPCPGTRTALPAVAVARGPP